MLKRPNNFYSLPLNVIDRHGLLFKVFYVVCLRKLLRGFCPSPLKVPTVLKFLVDSSHGVLINCSICVFHISRLLREVAGGGAPQRKGTAASTACSHFRGANAIFLSKIKRFEDVILTNSRFSVLVAIW